MTVAAAGSGSRPGRRTRFVAGLKALVRNCRSLFPVAVRVVLTHRRRDAMMAAIVALSLVFYCLYAVFLDMTIWESRRIISEMRLPSDIVAYVPAGIGRADLSAVQSLYYLRSSETAVFAPAATSVGLVDLLCLGEGSEVLAGLGPLVAGRLPEAGECILPEYYLERSGLGPGDSVVLNPVAPAGRATPARLPAEAVVAGFFAPLDGWFDVPVVVVGAPDLASSSAVNVFFAWCDHPEVFLGRAVSAIRNRLTPDELQLPYVAQRSPVAPQVMVGNTSKDLGRDLQRAVYFPTGEAMFLLYVFFVVGLFTLMLLTFLDRRREYAIMKTLGLTSVQIGLVLYIEVAIIGLAGILLGTGTTLAILGALGRVGGLNLRVSGWILATASALGIIALVVSVWFPIGMARLASVANLLGGQAFRPFGYERRWSEKRGATAARWSSPRPEDTKQTGPR